MKPGGGLPIMGGGPLMNMSGGGIPIPGGGMPGGSIDIRASVGTPAHRNYI